MRAKKKFITPSILERRRQRHYLAQDFGAPALRIFEQRLKLRAGQDPLVLAENLNHDQAFQDLVFNQITCPVFAFAQVDFIDLHQHFFPLEQRVKAKWNQQRHRVLRLFFKTALQSPYVRQWLVEQAEVKQKELDQPSTLTDLLMYAQKKSLPDVFLLLCAWAWKMDREIREKKIKNLFKAWKADFIKRFPKFLNSQDLGLDMQQILQHIHQIDVICKDLFVSCMFGPVAQADPACEAILISPEILPYSTPRQFDVLYHEALHLLSTKKDAKLRIKRIGFYDLTNQISQHKTFWLNEAMTEKLTLKILKRDKRWPRVYLKEMKLFELLLSQGYKKIPEREIVLDFFQIQASKKSIDQLLKAAYPLEFLETLDQFIQTGKMKEGIIFLTKNKKNVKMM